MSAPPPNPGRHPGKPSLRRGLPALVALLAAASFVLRGPPLRADVVVTKDGTRHEGKVLSQDGDQVVVETTFDGTKRIPKSDVASVDTRVPPLREQLKFRANEARDDVAKLWDLHRWAKEKGFRPELKWILLRIVEIAPEERRARKLLGHELVDGTWMTPEEKAAHLEEKHAAEMRAKGLVPHDGRWVTPAEKDAIEKGLVKDGDEWVSEEEFHRRRGEAKVDGQWVRLGEREGRAWGDALQGGTGLGVTVLWGPHVDVLHDAAPEAAQKALEGAEAMFAKTRSLLRPRTAEQGGDDLPETVAARIRLALFRKQPAYAKFATWFDARVKASELVPGWARAVAKQHSFWWADPDPISAAYQFPNTEKTFVSNVLHGYGLVLLTRYRMNYRFPSTWLQEGFAYWLEMETLGYSESFTLGRGGGGATVAPGATAEGQPPAWSDSARWKAALSGLVTEGRDPPLKRMATMTGDQMGYEELVKSWSVVECLVRKDPKKFKAFVDGVKESGSDEETALRNAFGGGYREIDQTWRAYVTAGFVHP